MSKRWLVVLVVALGACGGGGPPAAQPGVIDLPGGGWRVTLTARSGSGIEGQGWDLTAGRITPDRAGADFYLRVSMVVALVPTISGDAFCVEQPAAGAPAFVRVEDVPGDATTCTANVSAQLGGTFEHGDSAWAGQGYLLRDGAGVGRAKLLIVDDHVIGGDIGVTLDIMRL